MGTFECYFCKEDNSSEPADYTYSITKLGRVEGDGRKLCEFCLYGLEETARIEITNAAISLGRLGGKKGGIARAKVLTPERRKEIAQQAARKRWAK